MSSRGWAVAAVFVAALAAGSPSRLLAQQPPTGTLAPAPELERKSEVGAAVLEALVPILGHAYAGDAEAGVPPALMSAVGVLVMIGGMSTENRLDAFLWGSGVYSLGRILGIVSAYSTAVAHNRAIRLSVSLIRRDGGVGVALGLSR